MRSGQNKRMEGGRSPRKGFYILQVKNLEVTRRTGGTKTKKEAYYFEFGREE